MGPGWVVGGLLAATILSTGMTAGSTPVGAVSGVRSAGPGAARLLLSVADRPAAAPIAAGVASATLTPVAAGTPGLPSAVSATARSAELAAPRATLAPVKRPSVEAATLKTPVPTPKPAPKQAPKPTPKPTVKPTPKPAPAIVYLHRASGRATWGGFGGAVITRLPPGTLIRVCGRLGCWAGESSGFGPSPDGGNLVDLDAAIFRRICGPLATGVGSVELSWR